MSEYDNYEIKGLGDPRRAEIWQVLLVIVLLAALSLSGFYLGSKHRGIAQIQNTYSDNSGGTASYSPSDWPPAGFTVWNADSNLAYMFDNSSQCSGTNTNGCSIVQVVSQVDCSTLVGSGDFTLNGATVETDQAQQSDIKAGPENSLEFDTTGSTSDSFNLNTLQCEN